MMKINYRANYLKQNKSNIHMCAYCFKVMTTDEMTVDHILPQRLNRVLNKFSIFVLFISYLYLLYSYNSGLNVKVEYFLLPLAAPLFSYLFNLYMHSNFNLVSCCTTCNSKKKAKLGMYVIRGNVSKFVFSLLKLRSWLVIGLLYVFYLNVGGL